MKRSVAALLVVAACATRLPPTRQVPPALTAPALAHVPPGCEAVQSGTWTHAGDPTWLYRAEDDGGTLVLWPERAPSPGADGGRSVPGDGGTRIMLQRRPEGFVGFTQARAFTSTGQACAVEFQTEVVACQDGGLLLRAAASTAIDEQCRPPGAGALAPRLEHLLVPAPALQDAGAWQG